MCKKIVQPYTLIILAALSPFAFAYDHQPNAWLPITGRLIASGGITNVGIFGLDGMIPLWGNNEQFVLADLVGAYGTDQTGLGALGFGYRSVVDDYILGGYLFGDYDHTSLGGDFGVLSPGFEFIGLQWDAHVNGYFPIHTTQYLSGPHYASYYGFGTSTTFETGTHNQYDALLTEYDVIGNGVDTGVGYSFQTMNNLRSRVYVGGYYYAMPSGHDVENYRGVTAGFTQPLNTVVNFSIFNSYDSVTHYNIGFNFTLTLGGKINTFSKNIKDRLLDPIERHIGIIATGAGTYDQQGFKSKGTGLIYDDVYFFSTTGRVGATGTYGDPLLLDQASLDYVNADSPTGSRLYFQGGAGSTYFIDGSGSFTGLTAYNGQDFYGRTADYTQAASGDERPTFYLTTPSVSSSIFFVNSSNANNVFSDLQFTADYISGNSNHFFTAFSSTVDLTFNNVNIYNFDNAGIYVIAGSGSVSVTDSTFLNNNQAMNIEISDGTVDVSNTSVATNSGYQDLALSPSGIQVTNSGTGTLNFNANALSVNFYQSVPAAQTLFFVSSGSGTLNANINNSSLIGNTMAGTDLVFLLNSGSGNLVVNIYESYIYSTGGTSGGAGDIQINSTGSGITTLNIVRSSVTNGAYYSIGAFNNAGTGTININIDQSDISSSGVDLGFPFTYGNIALVNFGGTGTTNLSATNSSISNSPTYGLSVINLSAGSQINVNDLTGTTFSNNALGGITGYASTAGSTTIDFTNAIFSNTAPNISYLPGSQPIHWIP